MLDKDTLIVLTLTPGIGGVWGLPALDLDIPGTGKTMSTDSFAQEVGLPFKYLSPGLHGDGGFGCVPVPVKMGKITVLTFPPARWAHDILRLGRGLILLDELTTAQPMIQAAMLGMVNERRIGDTHLGAGCRVIAAGNPIEYASGGVPLSPAMANRLGHIEGTGVSFDGWKDWLLTNDGLPRDLGKTDGLDFIPTEEQIKRLEAREQEVLTHWSGAYAQAKGLVAGFLSGKPDLLSAPPKANDPRASGPWPSARTWHLVTHALAGCVVHGYGMVGRDLGPRLASAFVGEGPQRELFEYWAKADLPDPREVLEGKTPFQHSTQRLDRTVAVLSACAALAATDDHYKEMVSVLWGMLRGVIEAGDSDLAVGPTKTLVRAGLLDGGDDVLADMHSTLQEAGVVARRQGLKGSRA